MSFTLKNGKCHLKNDKNWSCIAGYVNKCKYWCLT